MGYISQDIEQNVVSEISYCCRKIVNFAIYFQKI